MLAAVGVCPAQVGGQGIWTGAPLAQVSTSQLEAMSTVNDAIDIRVAARQTADNVLPTTKSNLAGDQPRIFAVVIVGSLNEIALP